MRRKARMKKNDPRRLTEEEKQKIVFVVNDLFSEDFPDEPSEYDVLMKKKLQEFTNILLKNDDSSDIEELIEMCEEYINGDRNASTFGLCLGLAASYDMWLNNSPVWPVPYNPEWDEWGKLKEKKAVLTEGERNALMILREINEEDEKPK